MGDKMNKLDFYLHNIIGNRTKRNIVNESGDLLVPKSTIITYDHVIYLEENGITLKNDDVQNISEDTDQNTHSNMIDDTVDQVRNIFDDIRKTKKIPVVYLREHVNPMIHAASDSKHLLQLFSALQAKDDYTYRHNIAVGAIANLIGKWMNLDYQELLQLTTAALLHDVGKMMIPESILNKPGKLNSEEYAIMKKHTIYGYDLLKETVGITHRQA